MLASEVSGLPSVLQLDPKSMKCEYVWILHLPFGYAYMNGQLV